jgi:phosphoglycolate phosphatase-like HAD superfamily hydrolase
MKIKNIIFDYDRVLADVNAAYVAYFRTLPGFENFQREDIPKIASYKNGVCDKMTPEHQQGFDESPHRFDRPPLPGAIDVLCKFRDAGLRRFLLTATSNAAQKRKYVEKYFGNLVEFNNSDHSGKLENLRKIISENNLEPKETVFIDDNLMCVRDGLKIPGLKVVRMQPEFYTGLPDDLVGKVPVVKSMDEFFDLIMNGEAI